MGVDEMPGNPANSGSHGTGLHNNPASTPAADEDVGGLAPFGFGFGSGSGFSSGSADGNDGAVTADEEVVPFEFGSGFGLGSANDDDGDDFRPMTSTAARAPAFGERPTTSSGRPTTSTGRPTTSRGVRSGSSFGSLGAFGAMERPGTSRGASMRPSTSRGLANRPFTGSHPLQEAPEESEDTGSSPFAFNFSPISQDGAFKVGSHPLQEAPEEHEDQGKSPFAFNSSPVPQSGASKVVQPRAIPVHSPGATLQTPKAVENRPQTNESVDLELNVNGRSPEEMFAEWAADNEGYEDSDDGDVFAYAVSGPDPNSPIIRRPERNTDISGVASPASAVTSPNPIDPPSSRRQGRSQDATSAAHPVNTQQVAASQGRPLADSIPGPSRIRHRSAFADLGSPGDERDTIEMRPMQGGPVRSQGPGVRGRDRGRGSARRSARGSDRGRVSRSGRGGGSGGTRERGRAQHATASPSSDIRPVSGPDPHNMIGINRSGTTTQQPAKYQQIHPGRMFNFLDPDLEDSEYAEVRGSVSNIDFIEDPSSTIRMWTIAFFILTVSSAANTYWTYRFPSPTITLNVAILVAWPLGTAAEKFLPNWDFTLPRFLGGEKISLNPGPWSMKEHSLIAQMAIIALNSSVSYPVYALTVQELPLYWNNDRGQGYATLFAFSTAFLGIGLGGLCRRFLVRPASMLWPQNLQATLLLNVLFARLTAKEDKSRFTRVQWFLLVVGGAFVWNFFPSFIFTSVSGFAWITWLAPNSIPVNYIFGYRNGISLVPFTLDWSQLSFLGSPLITPWWAGANALAGHVVVTLVVGTSLYLGNAHSFAYLPFFGSSGSIFDFTGAKYKVREVLTGQALDVNKYHEYSPLYMTVGAYLGYWGSLACAAAFVTHTVLHHSSFVWRAFRSGKAEADDVHARQMQFYKEVPRFTYPVMIVIGLAMSIAAMEVFHVGLPIWALLISIAWAALFTLPSAFLYAQTNFLISTNVTSEVLVGYLLPGKPIPDLVFKAFAVTILINAVIFLQGLKLGHYLKVPPRVSFTAQTLALLWVNVVQIGVKQFLITHVSDLCTATQSASLTCPGHNSFYSSSIIWGALGPSRIFSNGAMYSTLWYSLLAGGLLPIPFYFLAKHFSHVELLRHINVPAMFATITPFPGISTINVAGFVLVNFIFEYLIRRFRFKWWDRKNYLLSAGLDSGTAISGLIIFFALQLPKNGNIIFDWVGQHLGDSTRDTLGTPIKPLPPGGIPKYHSS